MRSRPLRRTARLLGLTSLGLGTSMLVSPMGVARAAGVDDAPNVVPLVTVLGVRELVHATGLLAGRPGWAWTRVLGDVVDLAAMGAALSSRRGERERRLGNATVVVSGFALLDLLVALRSRRASTTAPVPTPRRASGPGLVAPLIDVRPALAGQPRRPLARDTDVAADASTVPGPEGAATT